MKVDHTRPAVGSYGVDVRTSRAGVHGPSARSGDSAQMSGDVELARKAMAVATAEPGIRPEAVARGRALLERGEAGANADALADAMISRLLESWRME